MKYLVFLSLIFFILGCANFPETSKKYLGEWKQINTVEPKLAKSIVITSAGNNEFQIMVPKRDGISSDHRELFKGLKYDLSKDIIFKDSGPFIQISFDPEVGNILVSSTDEPDINGSFKFVER